MDDLKAALERMQIVLKEKQQKENTLSTSSHGLAKSAGSLTIQQGSSQPERVNTSGQKKQSDKPLSPGDLPISDCKESQQKVSAVLFKCFNSLKVYGKEPEQLKDTVDVFLMVLGKYSYNQFQTAISKYLSRNSDMPTPADIVNIIDPPQEELSSAMFIQIMRDCTIGGKLLWGDEKRYVDEFKRREMAKVRGGSDVLRDCESELARLSYEHNKPDGGYE